MSNHKRLSDQLRLVRLALFAVVTFLAVLANTGIANEPPRLEQVSQIKRAIAACEYFLIQQQSDDGTWRSKTYGLLKDGTSLTPLVVCSLSTSQSTDAARAKGLAATTAWFESESGHRRLRVEPQYPVYTASLLILAFDQSKHRAVNSDFAAWMNALVAHQLTEQNGWSNNDPQFGGWAYSHDLPSRPGIGEVPSPLNEPNLSATVFALEALNHSSDEEFANSRRRTALMFVERCQNWRENGSRADQKFNDGGFHFLLSDEVRNKPGVAGIDSTGQTRFISYGSATSDGLRALLLCGLKPDHPRVIAARRCLIAQFKDGAHSGTYPANRAHLQPALDFYYAASASKAFRAAGTNDTPLSNGRWATILAHRLLELQRADGSWSNPAADVREDDPLIATSFALQALQECLGELN